ncbi:hypothetical protein [Candidatus Methylomirabilis sp.]|uniref:hypothetical protein n=1 Tax=Candidatus Methylomirabilis sp. TaxID=2032687 RepID=UPI0030760A08
MAELGFLNMTRAELEEAVRLGMERLNRAAVDLAEQGWSLPMSLTPAETYEILESGTPAEIDKRFVRLYEADGGRYFERLAEDLTSRHGLLRWRSLITQVVSAYRRCDYAITIPALLTVCEGILVHGEGKRTKLRAVMRKRAEAEQKKPPDSIDRILWDNVSRFVDKLFKQSDSAAAPPCRLNRHWILHGRDVPTWGQADCLRLLQAVDTISVVTDGSTVQHQA